jgi:hypothetical protein
LATVAPAVAVALDLIVQLSKVVGGMPVSICRGAMSFENLSAPRQYRDRHGDHDK